MPEPDLSTLVTLLSVCAGLLFLILIVGIWAVSRLARVERLLAVRKPGSKAAEPVQESPSHSEAIDSRAGGAFEKFLKEDPARELLTKKEQSMAFRKWRQQNGMNWSNS